MLDLARWQLVLSSRNYYLSARRTDKMQTHAVIENSAVSVDVKLTMNWDLGLRQNQEQHTESLILLMPKLNVGTMYSGKRLYSSRPRPFHSNVEAESWFSTTKIPFPMIYGLLSTCFAPPQPRNTLDFVIKGLLAATARPWKPNRFLKDDIHGDNTTGYLLKLLTHVCYCWGEVINLDGSRRSIWSSSLGQANVEIFRQSKFTFNFSGTYITADFR